MDAEPAPSIVPPYVPGLLFAAALAIVPAIPGLPAFWITLLDYVGLYALVALGIVVLTGVGGITSFGQAMFVGIGAYTTAILTTRHGVSPWLALPLALIITAAVAWVTGVITLRLSGHYLPLGTIAWNISFFYIAGNSDYFGRYDGISGIPPITLAGYSFADNTRMYYLIWAAVLLAIVLTRNLLDGRVGRAIRSLRGGAAAAEAFGIDTGRAKILAFVYASVLAGVSGWLYAHLQRAINPTPFNFQASIEYLLMAVVGGVSSVWGAILGAGLVTILRDQLQDILPRLIGAQGNFETIVFGIVLVLVLQFAREGLWPHVAALFGRAGPPRARRRGPEPAALPRREAPKPGRELVSVRGLRKTFGGLVAVNEVAFDVRAGTIVALIGPNGAGKSTTFDLITGVQRATAGEVRVFGQDVTGQPSRSIARLGVARTFQHVKLVPGMSVIENVVLGAHLRGRAGAMEALVRLERGEDARLLAEAQRQLRRVGLDDVMHRPATSLALGQQRIVEIARALCLDPVLLLLDEPAAGLRHREKAELAELLRKLKGEGMGILLVEHDMDFVMGLTDRVIVMNFGSKLAEGRPAEVRADPAVVEAYLGGVA